MSALLSNIQTVVSEIWSNHANQHIELTIWVAPKVMISLDSNLFVLYAFKTRIIKI